MEGYHRTAHTVHQLHYHFVFSTKYRKPALRGDIAIEVRDLIREICRANDIEILRGHVRPDHVHFAARGTAALGSEPRDAGDQGEDLASSPDGSAKAARGVLGTAPVGAGLFRRDQRAGDRRRHCGIYSAARCRAPGRGALSN